MSNALVRLAVSFDASFGSDFEIYRTWAQSLFFQTHAAGILKICLLWFHQTMLLFFKQSGICYVFWGSFPEIKMCRVVYLIPYGDATSTKLPIEFWGKVSAIKSETSIQASTHFHTCSARMESALVNKGAVFCLISPLISADKRRQTMHAGRIILHSSPPNIHPKQVLHNNWKINISSVNL